MAFLGVALVKDFEVPWPGNHLQVSDRGLSDANGLER